MGYCYERKWNGKSGRLCCDSCGKAGGVRKQRCPFNWCPPPAYCAECRKGEPGASLKRHHVESHCKEKSLEYAAENAAKEAARQAGQFLFCAALGEWGPDGKDTGRIKVWFRGAAGAEKTYWTSRAGYEAVCGKRPFATPEDLTGFAAEAVR